MRLFLLLLLGTVLLTGCHTSTTIVNGVSERDANEIVVLLQSRGIDAVKSPAPVSTVGGSGGQNLWNIAVPGSQITESLSVLNQAGLPRAKGTTLLDLFGTQGLVPSDLQDKIRYQEGLSEQLANTIRKMDGIIDANVQITFPQEEASTKPLTASVYVKHRGVLDNQNSLMVNKIKRLVSSALPGLTIENVTVVTDRALLSDISLPQENTPEAEKDYLKIWSINVAKDSAARFRTIFYLFSILLFLALSALAWILWKFYPLIEQKGGIKALLQPTQIDRSSLLEEGQSETSEFKEE